MSTIVDSWFKVIIVYLVLFSVIIIHLSSYAKCEKVTNNHNVADKITVKQKLQKNKIPAKQYACTLPENNKFAISKKPAIRLQGYNVCSIAFSPNSKFLASGDTTGNIRLWNLNTRKKMWEGLTPGGESCAMEEVALVFTNDGTELLVASDVAPTSAWRVADGKVRQTVGDPLLNAIDKAMDDGATFGDAYDALCDKFDPHLAAGVAIHHFIKEKQDMALVVTNSNIVFWNPKTGKPFGKIEDAGQDVISLCTAKNANFVTTGLRDGWVLVRKIPSGQIVFKFRVCKYDVCGMAMAPQGDFLGIASGDFGKIFCWDIKAKKQLWCQEGGGGYAYNNSIAISPDGSTFLVGAGKGRFNILDSRTGKVISSRQYGSSNWNAFAFNQAGTLIATGAEDGTIAIWHIKRKIKINKVQQPKSSSTSKTAP